jgi:hypothetical protein
VISEEDKLQTRDATQDVIDQWQYENDFANHSDPGKGCNLNVDAYSACFDDPADPRILQIREGIRFQMIKRSAVRTNASEYW